MTTRKRIFIIIAAVLVWLLNSSAHYPVSAKAMAENNEMLVEEMETVPPAFAPTPEWVIANTLAAHTEPSPMPIVDDAEPPEQSEAEIVVTTMHEQPEEVPETPKGDTPDVPVDTAEEPPETVETIVDAVPETVANRLENCKITYYCCEKYPHICGTGEGLTATGDPATPGLTCAVDPKVIPLGTTVYVDFGDGVIHEYIAQDVGGAIKDAHIDLCVATHSEALQMGVATATVTW